MKNTIKTNNNTIKTNGNVYINSLEASDIYNNNIRCKKLNKNYVGMIPFSLELLKLKKEGLTTIINKTNAKELSNDIINVKFNSKVKSAEDVIKHLYSKISETKNEEYKNKLIDFIKVIENEKELAKWKEVKVNELREYLYSNGFKIVDVDEKTGEILSETKYIVYKRSSAKSRTGQVLFIKQELYEKMINWSRMGLDFGEQEIDFAGLLAYESLVTSSICDTIQIKTKNILIVNDVYSIFNKECNVVKKNKQTGFLDSFTQDYTIKNCIFDGQSLADKRYFKDGKSMKLLRNHFFKSASFNTNLQEFLKDNCPADIEYKNWKITNMFGEEIFAKDIHLVITPSSLKALKFNSNEKEMWNYWKKIIEKDNCTFGVCKSEKASKLGDTIQQTSYQMLNSLKLDANDMQELTIYEKEYIYKLKNDDKFFVEYIKENSNDINSNKMFVDLYNTNNNIVNTQFFRDFRKATINSYITHAKKGKIKLNADYCVLFGNAYEFLLHTINKLDLNNTTLKDNEIYTKMFADNTELVCFRNPHTSPSNVLVAKNTYISVIDKYFNLTNNIVVVNSIKFPLLDILSGADFDSDCILIVNNSKMLEVAKRVYNKFNIAINAVESNKKRYVVNAENMAIIDNQLSQSQKNIGETVNLGQLIMSNYWNNGNLEDTKMIKNIDICTVLSSICIDLAKKMYDIKIDDELTNIKNTAKLSNLRPNFWQYVSKNANISKKIMHFNCPMDFLYAELEELKYAEKKENVDIVSLLNNNYNINNADRKQIDKIVNYVEEMCTKLNKINVIYSNSSSEDEMQEKYEEIDNIVKYYNFFMQKLKVNEITLYSILIHIFKNNKYSNIQTKLLNILYKTQKDNFIKVFSNN